MSKLMGILAHIIRTVNHRKRRERERQIKKKKKKKRIPPMIK